VDDFDQVLENITKTEEQVQKIWQKVHQEDVDRQEKFWQSMTKQQQLDVFCKVVRTITEAEHDGKSYRGVLYDSFGFDTSAYGAAQDAGFIEIHNLFGERADS